MPDNAAFLHMSPVKSKKCVADDGEVFTSPWMVEAMLDHEIFTPAKTCPSMTVSELVAATPEAMP